MCVLQRPAWMSSRFTDTFQVRWRGEPAGRSFGECLYGRIRRPHGHCFSVTLADPFGSFVHCEVTPSTQPGSNSPQFIMLPVGYAHMKREDRENLKRKDLENHEFGATQTSHDAGHMWPDFKNWLLSAAPLACAAWWYFGVFDEIMAAGVAGFVVGSMFLVVRMGMPLVKGRGSQPARTPLELLWSAKVLGRRVHGFDWAASPNHREFRGSEVLCGREPDASESRAYPT